MVVWIVVAAGLLLLIAYILDHRKPHDTKLIPESLYVVTSDAQGMRVTDFAGASREVAWSALRRLSIRTTDSGPMLADVFWELEPLEDPPFAFPGGATGEDVFLATAQKQLAGFDNDQVIAAMGSTANARFLVWERPAEP